MQPREWEIRSRIDQLVARAGVARGSLSVREKVCGKANCQCTRGEKQVVFYLVASKDGRLRQLFIPKKMELETRECIAAYQEIRELLEELSQMH